MAPLQGFTDAAFRHCHARVYGYADGYFTPFVRVEHGAVRRHDLNDVCSPLNGSTKLSAQIIFRDIAEFDMLCSRLMKHGVRDVNLNMGCPFVPQVRRGRGAGVLGNVELLEQVSRRIEELPEVMFSVKMRLGIEEPSEWENVVDVLNGMRLSEVTLHPRTVREQYAGELHIEEFGRMCERCVHPMVFNGELRHPDDITDIFTRFPHIKGAMVGRGLIMRPSIMEEWKSGEIWDEEKRVTKLMELHDALLRCAETAMCGEHQVLARMRPYWEYWGEEFSRKSVKQILKASTLRKYREAVVNAQQSRR